MHATLLYPIASLLLFVLVYGPASCTQKAHNTNHPEASTKTKIQLPETGFSYGYTDRNGNVWFASKGSGAYKFDGQSFVHLDESNGLCDNHVSCIYEDHQGNMWFGTPSGACRYDGENFEHIKVPYTDTSSVWLDKVYPIVNPNEVMSILDDKNGGLWFGTNGAGAYHFDGRTFTQHLAERGMIYEDGLYHNIVLRMTEDKKGNIWFCSLSHGGVSVYKGEEFTHYTEELSDDFVRVVYCDSKGILWIGTHGNHAGGLDRYDGTKFTQFHKTNDGFSNNNVMAIHEDINGLLWMGSGTTELSTFDGKNFSMFKDQDGKSYDKILFVVGDKDNNIWFGNRFGLWRYDGEVVEGMVE